MKSEDVKVRMPVRRINESHSAGMKVGDVDIVTSMKRSEIKRDLYVFFGGESEVYPQGHLPCFLEPAYNLEVGCRVRVVDYLPILDGEEGTLLHFGTKSIVMIDGTQYPLRAKNLIVIEPAPSHTLLKNLTYSKQIDGAMFSQEDIEKCMVDIKKQEMDIYGKSALKITNPAKNDIICGIEFGLPQTCRCSIISHDEFNKIYKEEWKMPEMEGIDRTTARKLAEKVKDEFVGYDPRSNTVFLKKAGEVKALKREIVMTLTDVDIEKLLKVKGLDATLGDYEIKDFVETIIITIVKFEPVQKEVNEVV